MKLYSTYGRASECTLSVVLVILNTKLSWTLCNTNRNTQTDRQVNTGAHARSLSFSISHTFFLDLALWFLTWNRLAIELDGKRMDGGFFGLEVDSEPCVAFRLHVVWDISPIHWHNNLQVSRPSLRGVNCGRGRLNIFLETKVVKAILKRRKK